MDFHIGILIVYQRKVRDQHLCILSIGRKYIRIIIGCRYLDYQKSYWGKMFSIFYSNHMKPTRLAQDLYT